MRFMGHNEKKQYSHYNNSQEEKQKRIESIFKAIIPKTSPTWQKKETPNPRSPKDPKKSEPQHGEPQ